MHERSVDLQHAVTPWHCVYERHLREESLTGRAEVDILPVQLHGHRGDGRQGGTRQQHFQIGYRSSDQKVAWYQLQRHR